MGYQLQVYAGLYRMVIVIHRGYVKERGVADTDRIAHRLNLDAEAAPGKFRIDILWVGDGELNMVRTSWRGLCGWPQPLKVMVRIPIPVL